MNTSKHKTMTMHWMNIRELPVGWNQIWEKTRKQRQ